MLKSKKIQTEKKSETLEVRLSYSIKNEFMAKCTHNKETASHVIRKFIESYISRTQSKPQEIALYKAVHSARLKLVFLAVIIVMGMPVPEPITPSSPAHNIIFSQMDTNKDGFLTASDAKDETRPALFSLLEHGDNNEDGKLSIREIDKLPIMSLRQNTASPTTTTKTSTTKFVSFSLTSGSGLQAIKNQLQDREEFASLDADTLQALAQKISQHANQR